MDIDLRRNVFAAVMENYANDFSESGKHAPAFIKRAVLSEAGRAAVAAADPRLTSTGIGAMAIAIGKSVMTNEAVAKSFVDVEITGTGGLVATFGKDAKFDRVQESLATVGTVAPICRPGDTIGEGIVSDILIVAVEPAQGVTEGVVEELKKGINEGAWNTVKHKLSTVGKAIKNVVRSEKHVVSVNLPGDDEMTDEKYAAHADAIHTIAAKFGGKPHTVGDADADAKSAKFSRDEGIVPVSFSNPKDAGLFKVHATLLGYRATSHGDVSKPVESVGAVVTVKALRPDGSTITVSKLAEKMGAKVVVEGMTRRFTFESVEKADAFIAAAKLVYGAPRHHVFEKVVTEAAERTHRLVRTDDEGKPQYYVHGNGPFSGPSLTSDPAKASVLVKSHAEDLANADGVNFGKGVKVGGWKAVPVTESVEQVDEANLGSYASKDGRLKYTISHSPSTNEYIAKAYVDGKHHEGKTAYEGYAAGDKEDKKNALSSAHGTAKQNIEAYEKSGKMDEAEVGKIDKKVWHKAEAAAVKQYGAETREKDSDKFYAITMSIYKKMKHVDEAWRYGDYPIITPKVQLVKHVGLSAEDTAYLKATVEKHGGKFYREGSPHWAGGEGHVVEYGPIPSKNRAMAQEWNSYIGGKPGITLGHHLVPSSGSVKEAVEILGEGLHNDLQKSLAAAGMDGSKLFAAPGEGWTAFHGALDKHGLMVHDDHFVGDNGPNFTAALQLAKKPTKDGEAPEVIPGAFIAVQRTAGVGDGAGADGADMPMKGKHEFNAYLTGKKLKESAVSEAIITRAATAKVKVLPTSATHEVKNFDVRVNHDDDEDTHALYAFRQAEKAFGKRPESATVGNTTITDEQVKAYDAGYHEGSSSQPFQGADYLAGKHERHYNRGVMAGARDKRDSYVPAWAHESVDQLGEAYHVGYVAPGGVTHVLHHDPNAKSKTFQYMPLGKATPGFKPVVVHNKSVADAYAVTGSTVSAIPVHESVDHSPEKHVKALYEHAYGKDALEACNESAKSILKSMLAKFVLPGVPGAKNETGNASFDDIFKKSIAKVKGEGRVAILSEADYAALLDDTAFALVESFGDDADKVLAPVVLDVPGVKLPVNESNTPDAAVLQAVAKNLLLSAGVVPASLSEAITSWDSHAATLTA